MNAFNYLINSGVWGYIPLERKMTTVWGHKYHILSYNFLPISISIAIFFLVMTIVSALHLTFIINCLDISINNILETFYAKVTFISSTQKSWIEKNDLLISKLNSTNIFYLINNSTKLLIVGELYVLWFSPFILSLGLFFLWSAYAIEEGTISKINFLWATATNVKLVASRIVSTPVFHTNLVRKGFKIGFILFIISEVMFFFGFFWAFFHSSLSPVIQIGAVWPPLGVDFITIKGFAIANTVILLTSGATLTVAHYALELLPLWRIFMYKTKTPWNESQPFFNYDLVAMTLDWFKSDDAKTSTLEWSPAFDWIWIIQFKRYLKWHWAQQYYLDYYYRLTPFLMLTHINKYFYFAWEKKRSETIAWMYINVMLNCTLLLAVLFMLFQTLEYFISPVHINTGIYGSTFYMITGLHGFHVFIGTCFLLYCRSAVDMNRLLTIAINAYEISFHHFWKWVFHDIVVVGEWWKIDDYWVSHLGKFKSYDIWLYGKEGIESFECAAWYWHFVDVVWIFVFAFVYVWSHLTVLGQN